MRSFLRVSPRYVPLRSLDNEAKIESQDPVQHGQSAKKQTTVRSVSVLLTCTISLGLGLLVLGTYIYQRLKPSQVDLLLPNCLEPTIRREWRSLSRSEKASYVAAVKCLTEIPPKLGAEGTAYDEFSHVHSKIGNYSHEAGPFLPWHRYFIHNYEQTLQLRCGYNGSLPYWDWTLDWENFTNAPVWDADDGFGGDGNKSSEVTVGHGHCITDGPFATLEAQYYDTDRLPHCLSRDFLQGSLLARFSARLQPAALDGILQEPNYFSFLLSIEDGPHSAIPISVRGDFSKFTAPNDPVFFLHHAQVDRLWWIWQQSNLPERLHQYNGPSRHDSDVEAALSDRLEMHGLAPDIPVYEMMDTEAGPLCYRY